MTISVILGLALLALAVLGGAAILGLRARRRRQPKSDDLYPLW